MMSEATATHWNRRYASAASELPVPAYVLSAYAHLLQPAGTQQLRTLDLACGRGGNALYLARLGFESHGWDISPVAIEQLNAQAVSAGVTVQTAVRDVLVLPPPPLSYDVIVVSRFLDRQLTQALLQALIPGGLVFYQTFVVGNKGGPTNPEYLLLPNELLQMFGQLTVRAFEDAGQCGIVNQGFRNESCIVAQKSIDQ